MTRQRLHHSTVDSVLEVSDASGCRMCLRLPEKASQQCKDGGCNLRKRGGVLGSFASDPPDFDACVLDNNKLQGVFLIPAPVLARNGFMGDEAINMQLFLPSKLPRRRPTQLKYLWQPSLARLSWKNFKI